MAPARRSLLESANVVANAVVVLLGAAFVLTFLPGASRYHVAAYRLFMQSALSAALLRIGRTFGAPPLRPFSLPALKQYAASVFGTSDAHYATIAFMYMAQRPFLLFMVSPFLLAGLRAAAAAQTYVPAAQPLARKVLAQKAEVFHLMATTDIVALPALALVSFSAGLRGLLAPLVYTQMLRSRYHSAAGAPYHQPVWRIIEQKAAPLLTRLPPAAAQPVQWVQGWFTTPPGAMAAQPPPAQ